MIPGETCRPPRAASHLSAAALILAAAAEVDAKPKRTPAEHAAALAEQERWLQAREMVQCAALSARIMPERCAELRALPAMPKGHMLQCAGPIRPQHCADCTSYPGYTPDGHALWLEQEKAARLQALGGRGTCIACQRQAVARIRGLCGPCRNRQTDGRLADGPDGWVFASLRDATQGADPEEAQVREGARVVTVGEARQMAEVRKNQEREEREMATRKNRTELPQDCAEAPEADTGSGEVENVQPDPEPSLNPGCSVPEPEGETGMVHASDHPGPKEEAPGEKTWRAIQWERRHPLQDVPDDATVRADLADPFAGLAFERFVSRSNKMGQDPAVSVNKRGALTFNVPASGKFTRGQAIGLMVAAKGAGRVVVGFKPVATGTSGAYIASPGGGEHTVNLRINCEAAANQYGLARPQKDVPLLWSESQKMWCAELAREVAK
jgi:hypothetical protein